MVLHSNKSTHKNGLKMLLALAILLFGIGNRIYADDCQYIDNSFSGITFTPSVNTSSNAQNVSTTFASNQYFIMNVVMGYTYQIFTCNAPSSSLKMVIYEEGNPAGVALASSDTNTGNTCNADSKNVFLSFTSTFSGQVRVLINRVNNCASADITDLTVKVNVSAAINTQDNPNDAGTDSWIGHIYDGVSFNNYLGYYTQTETFEEGFGSSGTFPAFGSTDAVNYNLYSNGVIRTAVKVVTFSGMYRMNSTKRGFYIADLTGDDGNRLSVDGVTIYSDWTDHAARTNSRVLMSLSGNSQLQLEYYENNGNNVLGFRNFVQVFSNTLSTNTTQSVCIGALGSPISGNVFGALPAGISVSSTGYQWYYSTTPNGARNIIAGATGATFTPDASAPAFQTPGTYYIFRNALLSSTNNVLPASYTASNESNAAVLIVNPTLTPSITIVASSNPVCEGSSVTFTATPVNGGASPIYEWKVNGNTVGANSDTYTFIPAANDAVTCTLTSNATPCLDPSPVISNVSNMIMVNPTIPISVTISASNNPSCSGHAVVFTATPNNASEPSYQWVLNGSNIGTDSSTFSYVPVEGDQISCILTADPTCAIGSPSTSNTISMTITPSSTIELSSAPESDNQSLCLRATINNITYSTIGATGATFSGLPAGVTGAWSANVVTISGAPTLPGSFEYTVTLTGASCTVFATGHITSNADAAPSCVDASICIGNSTTLAAFGAAVGSRYVWYTVASGGSPVKTSTNFSDNTYTTAVLSASKSYWVSILNASGCESLRTKVTANFPAVSADNQTTAGTNTWIGYMYDGISFNNYYGNFTQSETFNQTFGGSNSCFSINSTEGSRTIYSESFSVKYRMNSSKKGLYIADLGSDDGSRLTVDGTMVYNNWVPQGFTTKARVLFNLTGTSSLIYDFFESGGGNQVIFQNFIQVIANTLSTNNNQSIVLGDMGSTISGDTYGVLPTGISLAGTGYQWSYSTTPLGERIDIVGATAATFTPNTDTEPFNSVGTVYLYRNAILSSANNVSPTTYIASNESAAAIITISPVTNFWTGVVDTNWGNAANWSNNSVPASDAIIEFATVANNGTEAANNLVLDLDRTVNSIVNAGTKQLIIPAAKALIVNNTITTDGNPSRIYLQANSTEPNATLVFHNDASSPVYATVEMYTKASKPTTSYKWQFFGIPLRSMVANPTFYGSYVRQNFENVVGTTGVWVQLNNYSTLTSFTGYEITQLSPKVISFSGILENRDYSSGKLSYTSTATYKGEHLIGNPYTAAIDISEIVFGSTDAGIIENTVYVYNTGSYADWSSNGSGSLSGSAPGQYLSIPQAAAGTLGLPSQIPSMQAFTVNAKSDNALATVSIPYSSVNTVVKNTELQRAPATPKTCTRVDVLSNGYTDNLWLFTNEDCTQDFDNGWDGVKSITSGSNTQIYAVENTNKYQVDAVNDIHNTRIGFIAGVDSEYTLKFTHQAIQNKYDQLYLFDKTFNTVTDITSDGSQYTFSAAPLSRTEDRFQILTNQNLTTEIKNNISQELKITCDGNAIFASNMSSTVSEVSIADVLGRIIYKSNISPYATDDIKTLPIGIYVVKLSNKMEDITTKVLLK